MSSTDLNYPSISLVIIALNESNNIESCIQSIKLQNYPQDLIEVIVVDNGSTDNTLALAKSLANTVLSRPNITVAQARNEGANIAKGEIIAFLDADCEAAPDWLSQISLTLEKNECITGAECHIRENEPWVPRAWFCLQDPSTKTVPSVGTANFALSKDLFTKLGGFNSNLSTGEDAELCARSIAASFPVISNGKLKVIHKGVPRSIYQFLVREIWHGLGAFGTFKINRMDRPLLGTLFFVVMTLLQMAGLIAMILFGKLNLVLTSSLGIIALLAASVIFRRHYIKNILHAIQLFTLFYFYYFARGISLAILLLGLNKKYYRKSNR